ncbi:uncharacterized protein LOC144861555 [Branchiostoma floridae x Branchiostoma japonicum]
MSTVRLLGKSLQITAYTALQRLLLCTTLKLPLSLCFPIACPAMPTTEAYLLVTLYDSLCPVSMYPARTVSTLKTDSAWTMLWSGLSSRRDVDIAGSCQSHFRRQ